MPAAPAPHEPTGLAVVSDAAGRIRLHLSWLRASPGRAVAIEDAVAKISGVRAVHAYPRTASVVVWYSPRRLDRAELLDVVAAGEQTPWSLVPDRSPRSAEVGNADIVRMAVGGAALILLGVRRYGLRRAPLLGPSSRLFATGATVFTGYPFLKGGAAHLDRQPVGGHRCPRLRRDRGESGAPGERGGADRALVAQHR